MITVNPYTDEDIDKALAEVVADAQATADTWFTTEPVLMTYNRFMKEQAVYKDVIVFHFDGLKDEEEGGVGKTKSGNSSGSRFGYAQVYRPESP